jgi:hypothetical protein
VPVLRDVIECQDDALLNAIGGGYPAKYFANLAQRLLTLELNNRQLLTGGETELFPRRQARKAQNRPEA